jgi:hypothetical protein
MRIVAIILMFLLLLVPFTLDSYATIENIYELIGLKILKPNPTICIMEPDETMQSKFWEVGFIDKIISTSQEWVITMNKQGGNWDFNYEFHYWNDHKYKAPSDYKQCNVFILFDNDYRGNELGYTSFNYSNSNHKYAIITIHTEFPVKFTDIGEYGNTIIHNVELELCVIEKTILHEFGHILGLGHYQNPYEKKSIMTPFLNHKVCNDHRIITQIDIDMLIMIYGNDGFEIKDNPVILDKKIKIEQNL